MLSRLRKAIDERQDGFTLIELLVVVIIIGILAAIAIPVFLSQRSKAKNAAAKSDLRNAATSEEAWLTDNNSYTLTLANLTSSGFKPSNGVVMYGGIDSANSAGGYCLVAANTGSSPETWYTYDSENGGLQTTTNTGATPPATGSAAGCAESGLTGVTLTKVQ